jgi:hypothetical protein
MALISIVRIVAVDKITPQGFDEPCHIAAGIKWLDQHDYTLDPLHPPLARYAVALPLYISGARFPNFPPQDTNLQGYCTEIGNSILASGGGYTRNLFLARVGILPFLCLTVIVLFFWTSQEFGAFGGCTAVFLFLTLPSVLAFSSLAYTDLPTMCMQFACLFAFGMWLQRQSAASTVFLGISAGLAFSSKLTSFLFLPCAFVAMFLIKLWFSRDRIREIRAKSAAQFCAAMLIGWVILWSSYGFHVGSLQSALDLSSTSMPSFEHSFGPTSGIVRRLVLADPIIPAPDFVRGVVVARQKNDGAPESYLLGREKPGGWWYFFLAAIALKTPIPFLVFCVIGFAHAIRSPHQQRWTILLPAGAVAAVFFSTIFVSLKVGTRHVLVVLPLLAVLAGCGASLLWRIPKRTPIWGRVALCVLLAWQAVASAYAQKDFLAYFNELAPTYPYEALIKGCDLDCGQDVFRLSRALRSRGVTHVSLGIWTSADLAQVDLPPFEILRPHTPVHGWVAVSVRAVKTGKVVFCQNGHILPNQQYPEDALLWLDRYKPVARVGRTILLYDIPQTLTQTAAQPVINTP